MPFALEDERCNASTRTRGVGWPDVAAVAVLVAESLLLGEGAVLLRPDLVFNGRFLIGDPGAALWVMDRLINGETLYRDVAYQYGPLTGYLHAAFGALFGATVRTVVLWYQVLSAATIASAYAVLRRQ